MGQAVRTDFWQQINHLRITSQEGGISTSTFCLHKILQYNFLKLHCKEGLKSQDLPLKKSPILAHCPSSLSPHKTPLLPIQKPLCLSHSEGLHSAPISPPSLETSLSPPCHSRLPAPRLWEDLLDWVINSWCQLSARLRRCYPQRLIQPNIYPPQSPKRQLLLWLSAQCLVFAPENTEKANLIDI